MGVRRRPPGLVAELLVRKCDTLRPPVGLPAAQVSGTEGRVGVVTPYRGGGLSAGTERPSRLLVSRSRPKSYLSSHVVLPLSLVSRDGQGRTEYRTLVSVSTELLTRLSSMTVSSWALSRVRQDATVVLKSS